MNVKLFLLVFPFDVLSRIIFEFKFILYALLCIFKPVDNIIHD